MFEMLIETKTRSSFQRSTMHSFQFFFISLSILYLSSNVIAGELDNLLNGLLGGLLGGGGGGSSGGGSSGGGLSADDLKKLLSALGGDESCDTDGEDGSKETMDLGDMMNKEDPKKEKGKWGSGKKKGGKDSGKEEKGGDNWGKKKKGGDDSGKKKGGDDSGIKKGGDDSGKKKGGDDSGMKKGGHDMDGGDSGSSGGTVNCGDSNSGRLLGSVVILGRDSSQDCG